VGFPERDAFYGQMIGQVGPEEKRDGFSLDLLDVRFDIMQGDLKNLKNAGRVLKPLMEWDLVVLKVLVVGRRQGLGRDEQAAEMPE
jgi:hypothetical protein